MANIIFVECDIIELKSYKCKLLLVIVRSDDDDLTKTFVLNHYLEIRDRCKYLHTTCAIVSSMATLTLIQWTLIHYIKLMNINLVNPQLISLNQLLELQRLNIISINFLLKTHIRYSP